MMGFFYLLFLFLLFSWEPQAFPSEGSFVVSRILYIINPSSAVGSFLKLFSTIVSDEPADLFTVDL